MGQAKQRKVEIEQLKNSTEPKATNGLTVFEMFVNVAKAEGWSQGYTAPEGNRGNRINASWIKLLKATNREGRASLQRDIDLHDGFDYLGGVADMLGGLMCVAGIGRANVVFTTMKG